MQIARWLVRLDRVVARAGTRAPGPQSTAYICAAQFHFHRCRHALAASLTSSHVCLFIFQAVCFCMDLYFQKSKVLECSVSSVSLYRVWTFSPHPVVTHVDRRTNRINVAGFSLKKKKKISVIVSATSWHRL